LRRSKYVGAFVMSIAVLLLVGAAVLPVGPGTQGLQPYRVDFKVGNCGPAGYVAFHRPATDCGTAAAKRLKGAAPVGLMVLALGMVLFSGSAERRGSRVAVGNPRVRSRSRSRSPRGRPSMPV
jgi:uncharacterized membrane protein YgdD (TMEM256/DUF423 family)